ncbi:MAG: M24 family metallopeptidase, partial [Ignavibacteria bacterium]|nr:M24 family metallopeptidase [Ignavibacteria bacterium]
MAKATIKSAHDIKLMRESCRIVGDVLRLLKDMIRPGITTKELDAIAEEFIRSQDGEPAFKGYGTDKQNLFPASLCTSIDDEVVHGIPGNRKLQEGEIVSI